MSNVRTYLIISGIFMTLLATGCLRSIDEDLSQNYYKNWRGQIIYSPQGNWFELGSWPLENVHKRSFEVLSEDYAKDKNHVYFTWKVLSGADAESFEVLPHHYGKDQQHVYYRGFLLEGIKPPLFTPVTKNYFIHGDQVWYAIYSDRWYAEQHHYALAEIPVENAHTFRVLDEELFLSEDERYLYYRTMRLPVKKKADFELLKFTQRRPSFLNGKAIYILSYTSETGTIAGHLKTKVQPLVADDTSEYYLKSYTPVSSYTGTRTWSVINGNLLAYNLFEKLHFVARGGPYKVDKKYPFYAWGEDTIYYSQGISITTPRIVRFPNSDGSFQILSKRYARNNDSVFYHGTAIKNADGTSFQVFSNRQRGDGFRYDAADKSYFYLRGDTVAQKP